MSVDLIDRTLSVTDDPEMLVKIILPHLRGVPYYAYKSLNGKFEFDNEYILELIRLIPREKISELVHHITSINFCVKSQCDIGLEYNCSQLIKYYILSTDESNMQFYATYIASIGKTIEDIFVNKYDTRYDNLINSHVLLSHYAFTTSLLFSIAEKLRANIILTDESLEQDKNIHSHLLYSTR